MAGPAHPGGRHGPSLRRQLLVPLFWVWALGMAVAVAGALLLARAAANAAFDRGLQDEASALAARVVWSDRGPLLDLSRQAMELVTWDGADRNAFVMVNVDGDALAGDAAVPVPALDLRSSSVHQPTLFDGVYRAEPVRGVVFTAMSPMLDRRVSLIVVESTRKRANATRDIQLVVVLPSLALGALTFGLLAWGIRRGLQPLRDVAGEVAARGAQDWRPLPLQDVPAEAVPLIQRINTLLDNAQRSMSVQRRFIADAAHQLRTPVAGMRVLLQDLQQELGDPRSAEGRTWAPVLDQLLGSSERMARLIGQLLSLARSETALAADAGVHTPDLLPVLREATEPLVLQALRSGRSITLEAPEAAVPARVHPLWFGEVVVNLLDNALRYGGPHIVLRVLPAQGGQGPRVHVEDDGPGIAADALPRLFEPFWRGDSADRRNDGGTGLGLAIAREIVERMGGQLDADSRPLVAGTRFTVRLAA